MAFLVDMNTKASKSVTEINDLLNTGLGSNKFRSMGGGFDCRLFPGTPVNGSTVDEM